MFPNSLEFIAHERRKALLAEAERIRLINTLQRQRSDERDIFRKVINRLGDQMVRWGSKLQNYKMAPSSQVKAIGVVDVECSQC
jgi:hypothetical protein